MTRLQLSANARVVLKRRYLRKDEAGSPIESPEELFHRVARAVASVERRDRSAWARRFNELMTSRRFLPNTPTLLNAGHPGGQLAACYVLPIDDSLDGIFDTLKHAAKIHQSGGGTGFSFSKLRPSGSLVRSTHGVASGPVSFLRIFDITTETIKQGGARRGANMAILRADHPDILEFIDCKRDQRSIPNFNISVGVTDEFMTALERQGKYWLRNPTTGEPVRQVVAGEVFDRIVRAAWECGDPGLVFLDRINRMNPTPRQGEMDSTNPCGEQPLLPFESCNLGSLNLGEYVAEGEILWDRLARDTVTAVRFLDNVIDLNVYPVARSRRVTLRNRKIGLGVMGFADLLLMLRIPYGAPESFEAGERIMSFIEREARAASAELASRRGAFPAWKGSLWEKLGFPPLRNATVTTVAPTGTISIIAGASSGIEPIFSGVFYRNVLSGERLVEIHPAVEKLFLARGVAPVGISDERIREILGPAWTPAQSVPVEAHVRMQAVFQRHSDSAVSKTVNLPAHSTSEDVGKAYRLAYSLGCKGITIYRDLSRVGQVLKKPDAAPVEALQDSPLDSGPESCPSC
ncbi:MAG: adenosylcobalamin-dependent ribonucleoside-diphosphate reductase [Oligoflexia bacterium]|nr:adenosylcobalamin-dependent ribonucleoside-diphosphate reductase [Oligoflexia bacterium]